MTPSSPSGFHTCIGVFQNKRFLNLYSGCLCSSFKDFSIRFSLFYHITKYKGIKVLIDICFL